MPGFRLQHLPPLFIGTALTFGGMIPFFNPARAIHEFGLPERIQTNPEAQACFTVYSSRATVMGMAIWIFYLRGHLKAVDTILALHLYAGAVDAWICWREGVPNSALFRAVATLLVGGWGLFGLTGN